MYNFPILFVVILFISQYSYAERAHSELVYDNHIQAAECIHIESNEYHPLLINSHEAILFNREEYNVEGAEPPYNYRINVSQINCISGEKHTVDLLPYWGAPGKVTNAFLNKNILFIIYEAPSPSNEGFSSDYYFVFAYQENNGTFSPNDKLTELFGRGADVEDLKNDSYDVINLYTFPYKTPVAIKAMLSSNLYQKLNKNEKITGVILRKTKLQESASYNADAKKYLIQNDTVSVINASAGWLQVEYLNPKKGKIIGWIMAQDCHINE